MVPSRSAYATSSKCSLYFSMNTGIYRIFSVVGLLLGSTYNKI